MFSSCAFVRPSVRLSVCPSVRPSVRSSVRPSVCPFVRLFVRPSVRPSVRLSVCPSVCPFVRLFVRPSVCPFVRPSVRLSVCSFVRPSVRLSVCPSVCPSVRLFVRSSVTNLWTLYFENDWTDFNANWHKSSPGAKAWTVDLGIKRSKVKVKGGRSYIWKPGGDITLDLLSRVAAYSERRKCCLWKVGRRVAHSFNCTPAFVVYASCWRTCLEMSLKPQKRWPVVTLQMHKFSLYIFLLFFFPCWL